MVLQEGERVGMGLIHAVTQDGIGTLQRASAEEGEQK